VLLHYLVKYKCKKTNSNSQQTCWKMKDTFNQNHDEWFVRCYTLLDPCLWISGMLNDVFFSGLRGLLGLPVHPQDLVLFCRPICVLQSAIGASCFSNLFSNMFGSSFLLFIVQNSSTILRELYFSNAYDFFITALSSLLLNACYNTDVSSLH